MAGELVAWRSSSWRGKSRHISEKYSAGAQLVITAHISASENLATWRWRRRKRCAATLHMAAIGAGTAFGSGRAGAAKQRRASARSRNVLAITAARAARARASPAEERRLAPNAAMAPQLATNSPAGLGMAENAAIVYRRGVLFGWQWPEERR